MVDTLTASGRAALSEHAKNAPRSAAGTFLERVQATHEGGEYALTLPVAYSHEQAVEHDQRIAELHVQHQGALSKVATAEHYVYDTLGLRKQTRYIGRTTIREWPIPISEALDQLEALAGQTVPEETAAEMVPFEQYRRKKARERLDEYVAAMDVADEIDEEIDAGEVLRRKHGEWSRFFLVSGNNGHIHSSRRCSTCNRNGKPTAFGWLPELSGLDEKSAVDAHGAILCTVCFPSAPLEWTNGHEEAAKAKEAEYCAGSGTNQWKDGKVRTGYSSGNGGVCDVCGNWAGVVSRSNSYIRKHKPKK